jgi:hypothetical protein
MTQILSYGTAPSVTPLVTYDAGEGCEFWVWRTAANYVVGLYDVDADLLLDGVRMFNAAEFDAAEQAAVYAMTQAATSLAIIEGSR